MATNLALDDKLIIKAQKLVHHKTKMVAVTTALKEYIARMKQMEIFELFDNVDFDPQHNYKKARKRRKYE